MIHSFTFCKGEKLFLFRLPYSKSIFSFHIKFFCINVYLVSCIPFHSEINFHLPFEQFYEQEFCWNIPSGVYIFQNLSVRKFYWMIIIKKFILFYQTLHVFANLLKRCSSNVETSNCIEVIFIIFNFAREIFGVYT